MKYPRESPWAAGVITQSPEMPSMFFSILIWPIILPLLTMMKQWEQVLEAPALISSLITHNRPEYLAVYTLVLVDYMMIMNILVLPVHLILLRPVWWNYSRVYFPIMILELVPAWACLFVLILTDNARGYLYQDQTEDSYPQWTSDLDKYIRNIQHVLILWVLCRS